MGECSHSGALNWGLYDGKLSQHNGKNCVARLLDDGGAIARCSKASEFIQIDIPTTYTAEDLANMVKNQVILKILSE